MDLNSAQASPVLTDPSPLNKSRLGIHSSLFPYSQSGPSFSTSVLSIPRKKPAKLDDVRSNGWLDAMKSSSPPRKKILKEVNIDVSSDDADVTYLSWMIKYPSALSCFQQIMRQARNKQIVIFLDYDGTLSPIVDDPDRAFMSNEMRSAVSKVAKYFPTAIISGRRRDKVYELVGLTELYYAGSHGMDIMLPVENTLSANDSNCIKDTDQQGKEINLFQPARKFLSMVDEVFRTLVEKTKDIKGAKVEDHKFCASQIMRQARNKQIVIFLDYDGTLSPIVDDPDRAFMSNEMRSAVSKVAKYFPTAIISGRRRDKVYELVGLTELYYAGSHGMDIMLPVENTLSANDSNCIKDTDQQGKEINLFQPARKFLSMVDEVFRTLVEKTKDIKGAKVEDHKFCASVHYRNVDENNWPVIAQYVHDVLKDYPRLRLTHGRKVLEVRPDIDWNKGKAVEFLLESLGFSNHKDVLPIYIGDDRTDEDAFKVLRGKYKGYGVLVSTIPKESNASFSLKDTSQVKKFLEFLAKTMEVEDDI